MDINSFKNDNIEEIAQLLIYCHNRWKAKSSHQEHAIYANIIKGLCGYYQYSSANVNEDLTHVGFMMFYEKECYVAHIKLVDTAEKWAVSYKKL